MTASSVPDTVALEPSPTVHGVRVSAVPAYAAEHSKPAANRYVFQYDITIHNAGESPAQLVGRHWVIIDADGKREDVRGPGVVGKTPRLQVGQTFRYQSYCPLPTRWGTMEGTYHMKRDDGSEFDVVIPRIVLHAD